MFSDLEAVLATLGSNVSNGRVHTQLISSFFLSRIPRGEAACARAAVPVSRGLSGHVELGLLSMLCLARWR